MPVLFCTSTAVDGTGGVVVGDSVLVAVARES